MNYKIVILLIAIAFGLMVFAQGVVSAENATGSYVIVSSDLIVKPPSFLPNGSSETIDTPTNLTSTVANWTPTPYLNNTRITQGQCVEVGGTYDVLGVIGFTTLLDFNAFGYYSRYEDSFDPFNNFSVTYIYKMPFQRQAYYNFYIDPEIFESRQGYWYQFNGAFERAANKRAFYVSDRCIAPVNETVFLDENKTKILLNPKVIETRHVSDILVSNDDPLYLNITGDYQMWLFGQSKKILGDSMVFPKWTTPNLVLDLPTTRYLNEGSFDLLFENYGNDGRYSVKYENNSRTSEYKDLLVPELRVIDIADVTGYQPRLIEDALKNILVQTDDPFLTYKMEVQEPYVDISGYQEIRFGNQTVMEVTGYTNKIPQTPITLFIDRENITEKSVKYPSMTVMTENGSIGDYRTFHGYLPLMYDNIAPGFHTLTAVLPNGKTSRVDFYVREEPKPHYVQPVYFKFIDGNPFYVPPTPVVVEKVVVKEVIKEVDRPVYIPVDYNTLAMETLKKAIPYVVAVVIIGIPTLYCALLAIRVYAERRTKKITEVKE